MEKRTLSPDRQKKETEEAAMDSDWVDVSNTMSTYLDGDPATAIAGDELLSVDNNIITCNVCQISFSGIAPYEQHMIGSKHRKKVIKESMKKKYGPKYLEALKNQEPESENPTETIDHANSDDDTAVITCDVCKKICTGLLSYKLHMKGKAHQKQLRKKKLIEKLHENHDFHLDDKMEGSEDSVYDVMPQVKPFAQCDVCNKKFSGPQGFQDHLDSGLHKKKLDMQNLSSKLTGKEHPGDSGTDASTNPTVTGIGGGDYFAHCNICKKNFSGPVPYQQHLISDIHKKNMKKLELTEKMKTLSMNDDEKLGAFHCKDCERSFSIPEEFDEHL